MGKRSLYEEEVKMTTNPDKVIRNEWWQLGGEPAEETGINWEGEHTGTQRWRKEQGKQTNNKQWKDIKTEDYNRRRLRTIKKLVYTKDLTTANQLQRSKSITENTETIQDPEELNFVLLHVNPLTVVHFCPKSLKKGLCHPFCTNRCCILFHLLLFLFRLTFL